MDNLFYFLMGVGFTVTVGSLVIALCEDYYNWRKRREGATLLPPPVVEFSKPKKRTAKKAVKPSRRK